MSDRPPPARVPTLTEVVVYDTDRPPGAESAAPVPRVEPPGAAALEARLLQSVHSRVAAQLDQRLREALAPALSELVRGLAEHAQRELSALLRDELAEAVAQELARQRAS